MVGAPLSTPVGPIRQFCILLRLPGEGHATHLVITLGLANLIRAVSVQPGPSKLNNVNVATLFIVHPVVRPRNLCPETPLRVQQLQQLNNLRGKLPVAKCGTAVSSNRRPPK